MPINIGYYNLLTATVLTRVTAIKVALAALNKQMLGQTILWTIIAPCKLNGYWSQLSGATKPNYCSAVFLFEANMSILYLQNYSSSELQMPRFYQSIIVFWILYAFIKFPKREVHITVLLYLANGRKYLEMVKNITDI